MAEELKRPLLPSIVRVKEAGIPVALGYGGTTLQSRYLPIYSKYCVIDDRIVLEGSFNWYNASGFPTTLSLWPPISRSPTPICSSSTRS